MNKIKIYGWGLTLAAAATLAVGCEQTPTSASSPGANSTSAVAQGANPQTPNQPTPATQQQNPEDQMTRVRAEEAIRLFKANEAVIIDVRGTDAFNVAHTKGAIDFPLTRIEGGDFKGLPRDKRIIAYCT